MTSGSRPKIHTSSRRGSRTSTCNHANGQVSGSKHLCGLHLFYPQAEYACAGTLFRDNADRASRLKCMVQGTKPKKPHATSRRARAHKLDKAKAAVKDAARRVHRTKQLVEPCVAYVGNVCCYNFSRLGLVPMTCHKDWSRRG